MKIFEDLFLNRIMLFVGALVAFFFSVFCGLMLESKTLYEDVRFSRDNGMTFGMQIMENNDAVHLFCVLPEMVEENELTLEANGGRITFSLADGTVHRYESGDKIETEVLKEAVFCKIDSRFGIFAYENDFRYHEWSGLPTVSIDLKRSSLEDISVQKGLWCYADYVVSDVDGEQIHNGNCEVKVHGNTTFFYPKKSLDMKMEEITPLLGMEGGKRWVLISNYEDPSFMKNVIAYELQRKMGVEYGPDAQFVNVYVNDSFQGLYLLVERPDGGSVTFTLQEEAQEAAESYMLELCGELTYLESPSGFETNHRYVTIRYPNIIGDRKDALANYVQKAESALYMENGENNKEYLEYFDAESFAIQYLMQEFMKNYDTELNSQYIYLTDGGKIKAGPAWDFGISMYKPYDTPMDGADLLHVESLVDEPKVAGDMWFGAIDSHEEVHELIKQIYTEKFYYKAKQVVEYYNAYSSELAPAADMDAYLWRINSESFVNKATYTTAWMMKRLEFLYDYYMNEEDYCLVTFKTGLRYDAVLPVKRGDNLEWIPNEGTWQEEAGLNAKEGILIERDMIFSRIEGQ